MILAAFLLRSLATSLLTQGLLLAMRHKSASVRHFVVAMGLISILILIPMQCLTQIEGWNRLGNEITITKPVVPTVSASSKTIVSKVRSRSTPVSEQIASPIDVALGSRLWLVGVAVLLGRLVIALAALGRKVRRLRPIDLNLGVAVLMDPDGLLPLTTWWGKHLIVFPADWEDWSEDRLTSVLKHEMAHIERGDWWLLFAANVACAITWPNPLVWLMRRQCVELGEHAVDDRVISSGVPADRYAHDLLHFAIDRSHQLNSLSLPMAIKPLLSKRIEMLLKNKKQRGAASLAVVAGVSAIYVLVTGETALWSLVEKPQATSETQTKASGKLTQYMIKETWYQVEFRPDFIRKLDKNFVAANLKSPWSLNLSSAEINDFVAKCGGKKLESPAVRTIDSLPAEMNCSTGADTQVNEKVTILPGNPDSYRCECKIKDIRRNGIVANIEDVTFVMRPSPGRDGLFSQNTFNCVLTPGNLSKQFLIVHTFSKVADPVNP